MSWDHDDVQIVLSDGLGSGIQASIASTLTTALVSAMSRSRFSIEDCICAVEAVLPVTKKHGLAYATFTLAATDGNNVHLIQYDNPLAVFLRDGVSLRYPYDTLTIGDKTILETSLSMKSGDMLVLFSDGISEAGRGVTTYSGWNRDEMEDYLLRSVGPDDHARRVAAGIVSAAQALDLFSFHDDTTVDSTPCIHYPAFLKSLELLRPDKYLTIEEFWTKNFSPGLGPFYREELGFNEDEMRQEFEIWHTYVSGIIPDQPEALWYGSVYQYGSGRLLPPVRWDRRRRLQD